MRGDHGDRLLGDLEDDRVVEAWRVGVDAGDFDDSIVDRAADFGGDAAGGLTFHGRA